MCVCVHYFISMCVYLNISNCAIFGFGYVYMSIFLYIWISICIAAHARDLCFFRVLCILEVSLTY